MSDAGCFVVQAHKVLFHLSVRCLKILINSIDLMWCLRYLVSGWCKKREFFGVATVKLVLRWLVAVLLQFRSYQRTGVQAGPKSLLKMSQVSHASDLHLRTQ